MLNKVIVCVLIAFLCGVAQKTLAKLNIHNYLKNSNSSLMGSQSCKGVIALLGVLLYFAPVIPVPSSVSLPGWLGVSECCMCAIRSVIRKVWHRVVFPTLSGPGHLCVICRKFLVHVNSEVGSTPLAVTGSSLFYALKNTIILHLHR